MSLWLVLGLFLISAVGIVLYFFNNVPRALLQILISLGAGTMFAVALVHILPESLEVHEYALYAFVAGFVCIYLLEEIMTPHAHDHNHHDHTHEDPHEHFHHVILVAWIAIFVHTLLDGLGIRAGFVINETLGMSILAGVAIHQVPVSLSLASMLRESHFQKHTQIILMILFALAAPIGFMISDIFIADVSSVFVAITTALAGGSLLYVSNVELLPLIHSQTSKNMKMVTVSLFVIGVIGMSAVAFFE